MVWYEDPQLWELIRPFVFPPVRLAAGGDEIDEIDGLLRTQGSGFENGTRVLDVPCGPGRHAAALVERGCVVTGWDLTEAHVEQAQAAAGSTTSSFHAGDMYASEFGGPYDVALNLFSSIGYSCDPEDDLRFFRAVYASLAPGGVFVIDTISKEVLARAFEPVRYLEFGGRVVKCTVSLEDNWQRVRTHMMLTRDGAQQEVEFRQQLYGASDLIRLLDLAGFDVSVFGGYSGRQYDHEASCLVAVGRKGPS